MIFITWSSYILKFILINEKLKCFVNRKSQKSYKAANVVWKVVYILILLKKQVNFSSIRKELVESCMYSQETSNLKFWIYSHEPLSPDTTWEHKDCFFISICSIDLFLTDSSYLYLFILIKLHRRSNYTNVYKQWEKWLSVF